MRKHVWFWSEVSPLLLSFCRVNGVSVNRVVNLAVQSYLGQCNVEELRLKAKLAALLLEEKELRRACNAMLRSGSYLPSYVQRVLKEPGRPLSHFPVAQTPLKALNPKEEKVFTKIAGRREQIAKEIADVQLQLLKNVKPFRLKPDLWKSVSRRRVFSELNSVGGDRADAS